jgi:hypothetical protein
MPAKINKNNHKTRKTKNNKKTRKFQKGGAQVSALPVYPRQPLLTPRDKPAKITEAKKFAKDKDFESALKVLMKAYGIELSKFLNSNNDNAKNYYMSVGFLEDNNGFLEDNAPKNLKNSNYYKEYENPQELYIPYKPTATKFPAEAEASASYIPYKPTETTSPASTPSSLHESNPFRVVAQN